MCDPVTIATVAAPFVQQAFTSQAAAAGEEEARRGRERGIAEIRRGAQRGERALRLGLGGFEQAIAPQAARFEPFTQAGTTGLRGLQELARGDVGAVTPSPLFDFQTRLLRQQLAAAGQTQSPSAVAAASAPLIAQEAQRQFQRRLQATLPLIQAGQFGVTGQAGVGRALGQARLGTGTGLANIFMGTPTQIAGLQTQTGDIAGATRLAQTPRVGEFIGATTPLLAQLGSGFGGGAPSAPPGRFTTGTGFTDPAFQTMFGG